MTPTELQASLTEILGADHVSVDETQRRLYSSDLYVAGAVCAAIIRPQSADQLAAAVKAATSAGYSVVPRGGGLTYVGGYTPPHEQTVLVDCSGLNKIVEIAEDDMYITVEAGVTWKQISDALSPLGLRLPFFGTFSGAGATVGGGLSNGAMFLGSARYGSVSEIVLGVEVALSDGTLLRTGQGSIPRSEKPFFRTFGPDLTGLFTHDCGALGIKTRATLRMIRAPEHLDYLSFLFPTVEDAARTLSDIARRDLVEEIYVVDPIRTRAQLKEKSLFGDLSMLTKVIGQEKGVLRGLKSGLDLIKGGRNFLDEDLFSVHMVCAGRSRAAVESDVAECRAVAQKHSGTEIPNSIPKATRAMPFPNLAGVLGPKGDLWAAINCKIAHSDGEALIKATNAIFDRNRPELSAAGVDVTLLMSAMSNHVFSYECVFRWFGEWMPLHRAVHPDLSNLQEPAPNPAALDIIARVRQEVVDCFYEFGAASSQIGRTYRYLDALAPETRDVIVQLKQMLDPEGRMNPGVLGLANPAQEGVN